jgi:hypothetical protein
MLECCMDIVNFNWSHFNDFNTKNWCQELLMFKTLKNTNHFIPKDVIINNQFLCVWRTWNKVKRIALNNNIDINLLRINMDKKNSSHD